MNRLGMVALLWVVGACAADPYPLLTPAGASQSSPAEVGAPVRGVVLLLQPRPGDRVELVAAEVVGLRSGADVTFYYAPPVSNASGEVTIGDRLEPLVGATAAVDPGASPGPGNDVGIVVEVTPRMVGVFEVTAVRLSFRLNGGAVQTREGITQTLTVCVDSPAPIDCAPSSS